jgi:glucose uptake protein GlcU
MYSNEITTGLAAAILAALFFGSYGVPMKGESATKVDVDPLVFQSYKAFTVFSTSAILILINNIMASTTSSSGENTLQAWSFSDFTPWAFVSASLWVPGGTAGVYAIRRTGLAISVGIWSCVIVILSFVWGVLIFHEKQRSGLWGAINALVVLCIGLCGIAYFSSFEAESKRRKCHMGIDQKEAKMENTVVIETTPLVEMHDQLVEAEDEEISLDLETYPHCGAPPHSHKTIHIDPPSFICTKSKSEQHAIDIQQYNIGLLMAVLNGVLAATIMVPLHYAPANATRGIGFSMSFGIAAVLVVMLLWFLRWLLYSSVFFFTELRQDKVIQRRSIIVESLCKGYTSLPSFHWKVMWRPGLLSGLLYSLGNLMGIVSIQRLGNFMGYSLNQSSMIVSGLWGIFYYKEVAGTLHIIGFLVSVCLVFVGILLLGREHVV